MLHNSKLTSLIREIYHVKTSNDPWLCDTTKEIKSVTEEDNKHMLNKAKKLTGADFQGMHLREVLESQKVAYRMKQRLSSSGHARYLPKLCRW